MKGIGILIAVLIVLGGGFLLFSNSTAPNGDNGLDDILELSEEQDDDVMEKEDEDAMEDASDDTMEKEDEDAMEEDTGGGTKNDDDAMMDDTGEIKTFTLDSSNFKFSVNEIRVKKGDTVKITLTNSQGFHDWTIDEFNARTKQIQTGETDTIEFVADKQGTFEYYCSVGSHRQLGMVGTLIVE